MRIEENAAMSTQERHTAEYDYPGSLFPESVTREITEPTLAAALAVEPDEEGYFRKGGWYALKVTTTLSERFVSDSGEVRWIPKGEGRTVFRAVVGETVHVDDIPDDERHSILRDNIRWNSREPQKDIGVRTRAGNWQIASDYDYVLEPSAVS